jgi:hypothetical protein
MDWLEKLSASLKPETPPAEWKNYGQLSTALGRSESSAKALADKMVAIGKWERKKFTILTESGKVYAVNHYRPKPSCAVRSART